MLKINFGCGSIQPEGWLNIDHDSEFNTWKDLRYVEDNSADIIVAHAVVQQWEWHSLVHNLELLHRKLKSGGILRISLPDIQKGFQAFEEGDIDWFPNGEEDINDRFSAWLTWYSTSCTLMTIQALAHKLKEVGFESEHIWFPEYKQTYIDSTGESTKLDTREHEFYFVEAIK